MEPGSRIFTLFTSLFLLAGNASAGKVLFDFENGFAPGKVPATDTRVTLAESAGNHVLRMETGHKADWPGITLKALSGRWDLSKYSLIEMDVKNAGSSSVTVNLRVDNEGADGSNNCNNGHVSLPPGEKGTLRVLINRRIPVKGDLKLAGMRGWPGNPLGTIDPAMVNQLIVFVGQPSEDNAFEIDNIRAGGSYAAPPSKSVDANKFFPFIDGYGQYIHKDWPGKIRTAADFPKRIKAEKADLAAFPGAPDRDRWEGWKDGPALQATGFFRTEKHDGKWWLVDPDGRLFFSHGIDCVGSGDGTPVEFRDGWFRDLPARDDPVLGRFHYQAWNVLHGEYKGKKPQCFDFGGSNLARKYPGDWRGKFVEVTHQRLASWGMNTIANWSDSGVYLKRRTPYTAAIWFGGRMLEGSEGYWGQFRDVFDPGFAGEIRSRMAEQKGNSAGDPWCIGYFIDNEITWGTDTSLAVAALRSPAGQDAKKAFVADLRAKYGDIGRLNSAWGSGYGSWEALLEERKPPSADGPAVTDLRAFNARTVETYFRTVRDAVKEVAPNNLYLGCRFGGDENAQVVGVAAKYCDVVSYNLYREDVSGFKSPGPDCPLIIGEFHFGSLDRGMFHTGLVAASDQEERARMYKDYVKGALGNPQFVGCHWFKYRDECTTGRELDGENYQIGFVDIVDTPYPETVAACREIGYEMYRIRSEAK
jgi:hypothetical protein